MLYPLKFEPILVERIWGGDALTRYGKRIPPGKRIGETWEISDRDSEQSVVTNGPLAGKTLRQLIELMGDKLLGGVGHTALPPTSVGRGVPTAPRLPLRTLWEHCDYPFGSSDGAVGTPRPT